MQTSRKLIALVFAVILFSGGVPASALPSSAPQSLSTVSFDPFSIVASWLAPADDGGQEVTSYTIEYESTGLGNWTTYSTIPTNATETSKDETIMNLNPNQDYNVRVFATNIDGDSPFSVPSNVRTLSLPDPPTENPAEFDNSPAESFNLPTPDGFTKVESTRTLQHYTERYSDGNPDTLDIYKTSTADIRLVDFNGQYSAPYYKTEDASMIQVETPEGSYVWDKTACAVTFYNGERITGNTVVLLDSDSFVFRNAVVGTSNWVDMTNLNNASCGTEIFEDGTNIEIRGTKISSGEAEVKIRYIKLAGELLKPQIELTNLNPAWSDHKFSTIQTIHPNVSFTFVDATKDGETLSEIEITEFESEPDKLKIKFDDGSEIELEEPAILKIPASDFPTGFIKIGNMIYSTSLGQSQLFDVAIINDNGVAKLANLALHH